MRTNLGCYRFNLGRRWSLLERIVVGALLNVWQSQLLVLLRQLVISWFGLFLLYNAIVALVVSFKNLVKVIFFFRGYFFERRSFEFFCQSYKSFTSVAFGIAFVRFVFNLWFPIYLYGGLLLPFPLLLNWRFSAVLNKQIWRVNNNYLLFIYLFGRIHLHCSFYMTGRQLKPWYNLRLEHLQLKHAFIFHLHLGCQCMMTIYIKSRALILVKDRRSVNGTTTNHIIDALKSSQLCHRS